MNTDQDTAAVWLVVTAAHVLAASDPGSKLGDFSPSAHVFKILPHNLPHINLHQCPEHRRGCVDTANTSTLLRTKESRENAVSRNPGHHAEEQMKPPGAPSVNEIFAGVEGKATVAWPSCSGVVLGWRVFLVSQL